jgi:hypothetical protein
MIFGGMTRLSEEDKKLVPTLVANSNKAFRALRYPDYIKAVDAEEDLVNRYRAASPK